MVRRAPHALGYNARMPQRARMVWLVRHADTDWSQSGRHTSRTDLPLLPRGEERARALASQLAGVPFELVLTSPRLRARHTAELCGFGDRAIVDGNLAEWDYGQFEGKTTEEIHRTHPGWDLWTTPTPGGETIEQVAARCRAVIERVDAVPGNSLLFLHGHVSRLLAALWVGLPPQRGQSLATKAASIGVLGYEHGQRVIWQWDKVDAFEGH
jgi:broad specificity phosphatase PhoE